MKNSYFKLNARIINSHYGARMYFFTFFMTVLKLIFFASGIFCFTALFIYLNSESGVNLTSDILYCMLFSSGTVFSICFFILSDYTLKSEIFKTSVSRSDFYCFRAIKIKLQLKIIYLYLTKIAVDFFKLLFYLLPAAVSLLTTVYFLKNGLGIQIFLLLCALSLSLFLSGIYFFFCSKQALTFLPVIIYLKSECSVAEILNISKQACEGKCRKLAKLKLSFVPLFISCLLIIPSFFVLAYYYRCTSLYAKKALKVKPSKPEKEKPVIITKILKITAN